MAFKSKTDDGHCHSTISTEHIRDGCARFRWTIRTWVHFHVAGTQNGSSGRVFQLQGWTETEKSMFKIEFRERIQKGFGEGAMWLVHNKKGVADLWCDVKIDFVADREDAHLVVNAVNKPNLIAGPGANYYRGSCPPGGVSGDVVEGDSSDPELNKDENAFDMHIPNNEVVSPPASQNVLWHEFGHYMGLHHRCEGVGEGYCEGQSAEERNDLMAAGNNFRNAHVEPFRERFIKKHRASYLGGEGLFDSAVPYHVWPFVAKGINTPGGPDRHTRPWIGTPMEAMINSMVRK